MKTKRPGVNERARRFRGPPRKSLGGSLKNPPPKRAVNVAIDSEVFAAARAAGINFSQALEQTLRKLTEDERLRQWQEEHRAQIESYDALIRRAGIFGEELLDLDDAPV